MTKLALVCEDWKALHRNTLLGFAVIKIEALHLTIKDVAVHEKNGKRWAQLPAKPMLKDGAASRDETGKIIYVSLMQFDSRQVADAFGAAVVAAVLEREPHAFAAGSSDTPSRSTGKSVAGDMDIPFMPEWR